MSPATIASSTRSRTRLSKLLLPLLTKRLLDHLEHEGIEECEIYWQGGEAMIMGPAWFAEAGRLMNEAAAARGRRFTHYLQTNLISYSPAWNEVLFDDVRRIARHVDGLPQSAPQTVQRRCGGLHRTLDPPAPRGAGRGAARSESSPCCTTAVSRPVPRLSTATTRRNSGSTTSR